MTTVAGELLSVLSRSAFEIGSGSGERPRMAGRLPFSLAGEPIEDCKLIQGRHPTDALRDLYLHLGRNGDRLIKSGYADLNHSHIGQRPIGEEQAGSA